ncbi:unnamed protein product [Caenorhabditis brenneri]
MVLFVLPDNFGVANPIQIIAPAPRDFSLFPAVLSRLQEFSAGLLYLFASGLVGRDCPSCSSPVSLHWNLCVSSFLDPLTLSLVLLQDTPVAPYKRQLTAR